MAEISSLTIHNQLYDIKDAIARESINYINRDFNNTKINGVPLRNKDLIMTAETTSVSAITEQEIDSLIVQNLMF